MKLNDIFCGGYSTSKNEVKFSLYDTNYNEVSALNGKKLTLTISDTDSIVFEGYEIVAVSVGKNAIEVRFAKKLDEATMASINALESNFTHLHTAVMSAQTDISTNKKMVTNAIAPIIMRENLTDIEAIELKEFYPEWKIGFDYKRDWIIHYNGVLYRVGQDHTSQEQWVPGSEGTTALYSKIEIIEEGYEVWKEWDGVSGSYTQNQVVKDPTNDQLYKSKIDNNVWGPPSEQPDYWELYSENE